MKDWYAVHDSRSERPDTVDVTSSPTTVYLRRNITQVEVQDMDGNTHKEWEYEQKNLTFVEYVAEQAKQLQEQSDALCELAEMLV